MEKHVLLFSGGIDSFVAYHFIRKELQKEVVPVYFDLGAPYNPREIRVVKSLLPETIIDTSLSVGDTQRGQNAFIPYRNLLLACMARKYGDNIWIAGLKDDMVEDKNPDAFNAMNECMNYISKPEDHARLRSPFWGATKEQVVRWWCNNFPNERNKILETISCYDPYEPTNYCGRCPSCLRKFFALRNNGFNIEFYNQSLFNEYISRAERRYYPSERCDEILMQRNYTCKKVYCFDIDGTLTMEVEGHDYKSRVPKQNMIGVVNQLKQEGHKIVLFTSRYHEDQMVTEEWLRTNNVKHDCVIYGKPYYDFHVDDKNVLFSSDGETTCQIQPIPQEEMEDKQ